MDENTIRETEPAAEAAEKHTEATVAGGAESAAPEQEAAAAQSVDEPAAAEKPAAPAAEESADHAAAGAADADALNMRLADAELRAAAALAGVPAAKLPYVVRMADRSELSGDDLSAAAAKAVAAVLAAVPELGGAAAPVGSMGDHRRVGVGETPEDKVRAEFARNL